MADIKIIVGAEKNLSYSQMTNDLKSIKDRLNKNPMKIKVAIDTSASKKEFKSGVNEVINDLNSKPREIKVKFNKASLTSMKKQFEAVTKFGQDMSDKKASSILKEMTKDIKDSTKSKRESASADKNIINGSKQYYSSLEKVNGMINKVDQSRNKFTSAKNGKSKIFYDDLKEQKKNLEEIVDGLSKGEFTIGEFAKRFGDVKTSVNKDINEIKIAGENTSSFFDRVGSATKRFMSYFTASQVIMQLVTYAKQMVGEAIKVESAMAQIQIVTGASDKQMQSFLQNSIVLAKELGQSITDVASSIETFARLGYNMSDSSFLAKYANIMSNVAKTDIGTSTTGITSIIKGYDMTPEDAEHVADVLTKVGQEYAISAEELMAAFQRGGAALHASGTDFEKSAALFAATNASLQNAETTGTLWKSVSARIRGAKTELEEMGEDTSDLVDGFSKYREEIKALSGVDIMKDEHTYKDMYDIFVQLAQVWENMEDVSQARVAEILGGTRNTSGIMSTINNIKDAIGAYESAMNSAGTATEANAIYMDTTEAKLGKLKASFQELSSDFLSSSITKGTVDFIRVIVEGLDKIVDTIGSIGTVLAGLGIYKIVKNVA